MQDDTYGSAVQPDDATKTASHDHMNVPGMTNGVPDQLDEAKPTGAPPNQRQDAETAAADDGSAANPKPANPKPGDPKP